MTSKPIVVAVTKDTAEWQKGAELGYANEAAAKKALGDGNYKILRHVDSSEYVAPERVTDGPATETAEPQNKKG